MNKHQRNISFVSISILSRFISISIGHTKFNDIEMDNMGLVTNQIDYQNNMNREEIISQNNTLDKDDYHFGIWVNYQQQFGAIGDKFLTIGGPSFGFNLGKYFFLGGGVYSSFGQQNFGGVNDHSFVYGGGIMGFRWNPNNPVVFRTQVLVGAIAFDSISRNIPGLIENRSTSLIVVPEIAFDIRLIGYLFLSISANYRYVQELPEEWSKMKGLGALSGAVSLGLSF